MSYPTPRPARPLGLLAATALLLAACAGGSEDDDDDFGGEDGETGSPSGGDGADGGGGGGGGDGVSPRIVEGYAGYSDAGALGVVAIFTMEVRDPQGDLLGGDLNIVLDNEFEFTVPIDGDEATYSNDRVSYDIPNIDELVRYEIDMTVDDAAGNRSNVWSGFMQGP